MRRIDIQESIQKIVNTINDINLRDVLRENTRRREKSNPAAILSVLKKFSIAYDGFNENEKKIFKIFNLEDILNPEIWAKMISQENETDKRIWDIDSGLYYITTYLPKLDKVFSQEYLEIFKEERDSQEQNMSLLTVVLPEIKDNFSSPDRLIDGISSIKELYTTLASISEHSTTELSIIAIDSGSDKSFDFLGNVKVVKEVKELILTIWDRIVFFRERKITERIDLVVQALPVIERINKSEKSGSIGPEQAEIFRRSILTGAEKFISSGALIPEIEDNSNYNPRVLMAPEPKMLNQGNLENNATEIATNHEQSHPTSTESNLSPEEQQVFNKLLKKQKGDNKNGH